MATPVVRLRTVALDCPDPHALAEFYAGLIGGTIHDYDGDGEWVELLAPGRVRIAFQRSDGHTPPAWPRSDTNGQQFHLDFDGGSTWAEIDAAQERAFALGARPLDLDDGGGKRDWRVYADPAGHPFCFCLVAEADRV
ncbi:VOC family protein [Streptomyces alboflavus]|uniref:VOC family protein n=1 Tax=Streptomyces alboflavus TaxID=67267 RepID=UPI0036A22218